MIRTLQIQDREISDANSYFVAKHGVITHSSGFWGNLTSIILKMLIDLLTKLALIIKVVALTRMLANPKILEETGVRVVWPSIFAQFPNFWPSCCWTIPKKTWQLIYQWNVFQNIWNIFENSANIFTPGLHLPLLCWHKYHPRGNGGNLTIKTTFIHNLDHTHNKLQIGWFLCNMG